MLNYDPLQYLLILKKNSSFYLSFVLKINNYHHDENLLKSFLSKQNHNHNLLIVNIDIS